MFFSGFVACVDILISSGRQGSHFAHHRKFIVSTSALLISNSLFVIANMFCCYWFWYSKQVLWSFWSCLLNSRILVFQFSAQEPIFLMFHFIGVVLTHNRSHIATKNSSPREVTQCFMVWFVKDYFHFNLLSLLAPWPREYCKAQVLQSRCFKFTMDSKGVY